MSLKVPQILVSGDAACASPGAHEIAVGFGEARTPVSRVCAYGEDVDAVTPMMSVGRNDDETISTVDDDDEPETHTLMVPGQAGLNSSKSSKSEAKSKKRVKQFGRALRNGLKHIRKGCESLSPSNSGLGAGVCSPIPVSPFAPSPVM